MYRTREEFLEFTSKEIESEWKKAEKATEELENLRLQFLKDLSLEQLKELNKW